MDGQNLNRSVAGSEPEAVKSAIVAEEQYLLELRQSIETLERTAKDVETRIANRRTLVAAYKVIPDEVLGRIFTMVDYRPYRRFKQRQRDSCYANDEGWQHSVVTPRQWRSRSPMNVCQVSQRWRRVAMSTPRAWNELVVDLKKEGIVDMMEYWFEKAKAVPIHVTLWCESGRPCYPDERVEDVELFSACMKQHILQVRSLRLVAEEETQPGFCGNDVIAFFKDIDGVYTSALQSIAISSMWTDRDYVQCSNVLPSLSYGILENLTSLDTIGFFIPDSFLASVPTSLTTLNLDAPNKAGQWHDYANILEVLSNLPNLCRLRLCGQCPAVYDPSNDQTPFAAQQIVHMPHLTKLTLIRYSCATYIRFLDAPALQYLMVKERQTFEPDGFGENTYVPDEHPHAWDGIGSLVSSFLARSRPSLSRFSAIDIGVDLTIEELVAWLNQMDTLKCLVISHSSALVDDTATALALKGEDGVGFRYCPDLKVFKCRRWGQDGKQDDKCPVVRGGAVTSSCLGSDSRWSRMYGARGEISEHWEF